MCEEPESVQRQYTSHSASSQQGCVRWPMRDAFLTGRSVLLQSAMTEMNIEG